MDLAGAVRSALAMTVAHLTGPVLGNSFDVNFGFSGTRRLTKQPRDARARAGRPRRHRRTREEEAVQLLSR